MPVPKDPFAFTDAMADILRLPDETVAMSYLYLNKYLRFHRTSQTPDPLDPYVRLPACYIEAITQSLTGHRNRHPDPLPQHPLPSL
ncbi:MAG: hypothetical protein Q9179_007086 [Wetmoreana sp. 5 TL-2023]